MRPKRLSTEENAALQRVIKNIKAVQTNAANFRQSKNSTVKLLNAIKPRRQQPSPGGLARVY